MGVNLSRRGFMQASAASAAALVIGMNSKGVLAAAGSQSTDINPFVRIDNDGVVTVIIKHFEMGQGTTTGLTTLVAEELDADWSKVETDFAAADTEKYKNLFFGMQGTGGSTAIANSFMQYRQAGAAARDLLIRAAAKSWNVSPSDINIEKGMLISGSKQAHFGQFINQAALLTPVENPTVKTPDQFNLIGKVDLPRKDSYAKTNGTATFAMDVKVPGMVYTVIQRSPKFGGTVKSFDASEASQVNGFIDARELPTKAGVAVYAKNTWAALKAREALSVEWDFSNADNRGSDQALAEHIQLLDKPQFQAHEQTTDQVAPMVASADRKVEADFTFPFLAHAPMEPMNCVIEATDNGVRIIDGNQFPTMTQGVVAHVLGLEASQVEIKTVYAGGSFGRRANAQSDYHMEAALAFAALGGKTPVKLVWSREDDLAGGYYRPMAAHKASIGLDADGKIVGWDHRLSLKSIIKGTAFEPFLVKNGLDHTSVEGVAHPLYNIPNQSVGLSDYETPMPVLWWRSVGHTHTAYAMESMMDMLATATDQDPVELRLSMLDMSNPQQARLAGVIKEVAKAAGWKKGDKRGFAAHFSFNTYVAIIADVSVEDETEVSVDKIHVAVDCGVAVNPDVVKAQMEGGVGFALGAIAQNEITMTEGVVDQENFPDYEPLRISQMPEVDVIIVQSNEAPTGVGEPSVPPTGPAVANAIFAQTGKRITKLPFTKSGFNIV
ncbi:molybdopterin cofactor-binding domain-containing protein [Curvivirga sp.]|uniref:xanthine dehydrogenase family protein molybdopterin-binding subunit n=1 Tax=Curvivirga sp. TaxID=2856848 RepID=UPI003B5CF6D4